MFRTRLRPPRMGTASAVGDTERSNRDWVLPAVMLLSVLVLLVAVAISSAYNPTPTNSNSGGSGSMYPHAHHSASYSKPLDGNGSESS